MGTESEDDFNELFEDIDLSSMKPGRLPNSRNSLIASVLFHLGKINFDLEESNSGLLADAYEYLIGQFALGAA